MPFKDKDKQRKAVREDAKKRRMLHDFLKFESYLLINALAISEEKPLLVRAVGTNTDTRKKEGNWVCWLSKFAVDKKKFLEHLKEANYPEVELGHFYLIKKASQEEIDLFLADRTEKLKEFLEALEKIREGK